tara:strand:- start:167 stop:994 length:828 start_codon:yes stop_codon:yes gene_type:complete
VSSLPKETSRILISKIHPKQTSGIFSKKYVIGIGETAFRRKNGISEDAIESGMLTVMSFWEMLQSIFIKDRITAYYANYSPFEVDMHIMGDIPVEGLVNSKEFATDINYIEQYIVNGRIPYSDEYTGVTLRISARINLDKKDNFLSSYLRGRNQIITTDVWAGIGQLILQRVFAPYIEDYGTQKGQSGRFHIQEMAKKELNDYLGSRGVKFNTLSFNWIENKKKFEKDTGINLGNPDVIKLKIDGEEFEFTFGQFFLWIGVIFVAFIAVLIFIFS